MRKNERERKINTHSEKKEKKREEKWVANRKSRQNEGERER